MRYTKEWAVEEWDAGRTREVIGFWGNLNDSPSERTFSNFHQVNFKAPLSFDKLSKSHLFESSEQYFMYLKALEFGETEIFPKILQPGLTSYEYKRLGRSIKRFDEKTWNNVRYDRMLCALIFKYQVPEMGKILLATGDAILVETSPFDKIWGVGLSKNLNKGKGPLDPDRNWANPVKWKGQNLLGFALMEVRDNLNALLAFKDGTI